MVPRQPGGQNAVEDMNAARHTVDQIFRGADAHEIARFILRQQRSYDIEGIVHFLFCLTHGKAADGNAGCTEGGNEAGRLSPEICLNTALHNSKQSLVSPGLCFEGTLRPTMGPLHGQPAVGMIVWVGTFVESHDNVRAQIFLDGNGLFRCKAVS